MGEQPIYTTKAHIFQIDAANKKQWVPLSPSAVFVQFVYDSQKNVGRIISADNGKPILNSTLHSNVSFLKTSQKFGQWADPKAVTVYGVGFGTESDLNRFAEKFRELRELVVNKTAAGAVNNGNGDIMSMRSNSTTSALSSLGKIDQQTAGSGWRLSTSVSMGAVSKPHSVPLSLSTSPSETHLTGKTASNLPNNLNSVQAQQSDVQEQPSPLDRQPSQQSQNQQQRNMSSTSNLNNMSNGGNPVPVTQTSTVPSNQTTPNSNKQFDVELGALRIENNRLAGVLKEANDGVEEWKRKSCDYRDEVHRLRKRLTEMEISASKNTERDSTAVDDLQRLLHTYKAKLTKLEEEQRQLNERLQIANSDRDEIQRKYDELLGATAGTKQRLAELHHTVLDKAEELTSLANKLANVL